MQEIIWLHYLMGLKFKDVSFIMNMNLNTVLLKSNKAIKMLQLKMKRYE